MQVKHIVHMGDKCVEKLASFASTAREHHLNVPTDCASVTTVGQLRRVIQANSGTEAEKRLCNKALRVNEVRIPAHSTSVLRNYAYCAFKSLGSVCSAGKMVLIWLIVRKKDMALGLARRTQCGTCLHPTLMWLQYSAMQRTGQVG
jgi:hypothetical protein